MLFPDKLETSPIHWLVKTFRNNKMIPTQASVAAIEGFFDTKE